MTKVVVRILREPESVQTLLAAFDTISERRAPPCPRSSRRGSSRLRWR